MKGMLSAIRKKHIKLLVSVAIIASLGFGMAAGLICGYNSLKHSLEDYVTSYDYPHAVITTEVTTVSQAEKIKDAGGVSGCDARLFADTTVKDTSGNNYSVRAFSYTQEERQRFVYWSTEETAEDSVLVEFKFAQSNDIKAGDTLSFRVNGEYRDYKVGGIVSRPETLAAKINDNSWGINYDFGYVYVPASLLKKEYEKDYAEKKAGLDKKSSDFESEAEKASRLLDEKQKEIDEASKLLKEKKAAFAEAAALEESLTKKRQELVDAQNALYAKKKELEEAIALIDRKEKELLSQQASLKQAKSALKTIDEKLVQSRALLSKLKNSDILKVIDTISELLIKIDYPLTRENVAKLRQQIAEAQKQNIPQKINTITASIAVFITDVDSTTKEALDKLTSIEARKRIDEIAQMIELPTDDPRYSDIIELVQQLSGTEITTPAQLKAVYDSAEKELEAIRSELDKLDIEGAAASLREVDAEKYVKDFDDVLKIIQEQMGDTDLSDKSLSEIYQMMLKGISDAITQLETQRSQIVAQLRSYGVTEDGIDDALRQISDGLKQCSSQRKQAQDALAKIISGIEQTAAGIREIDEALQKLREQLRQNSSELDNAEKDMQKAKGELDSEISRSLKERSEIEQELKDAYKLLDENTGYDKLCNEFLLYFDDGADPDAMLEKAADSLDGIKVKSSYTYADSAVKRRIDENLDPIRTMMVLLPIVFFAIVLIVIFLFMSMIIKQSRREIGILRALGFTRAQVRRKFCTVSLAVCIAAMIPGALISAGLSVYVGNYFKDFFPLPDFTYQVGILSIAIPAAATIAVTLTATLFSTGQISRIMPDEAMSRQIRASAKIPALLRPIINRLRPMPKVTVTSLMRSKGRFVMSTICIAASATLILTAFSFISSKNYTLDQVFDQRINYDCQIFFEHTPSDELVHRLESLDYTGRLEKVAYYTSDITAGEKSASAVVNAISKDSQLVGITDAEGSQLKVEQGGIILERHTADKLGVGKGDTVTFEGRDFTVTAVSDQCVNRIQYIAYEDTTFMPKPDLGCIVCTLTGSCKQELLTLLFDIDDYQYAAFTSSLYDYNTQLFATYDLAAWIVIAFAVTIGFVIVLNTMLTNLYESKKELAILRTLGFQRREISRSRLSQALLQFFLACLIGLPLGALLAKAALASISTPHTEYIYVGAAADYLFTAGIILAYLIVSHIFSMRTMKKWDITELVKDKE